MSESERHKEESEQTQQPSPEGGAHPELSRAVCPHCGSPKVVYRTKASCWECVDCESRFAGLPPEDARRRLDQPAARPKHIFFSYGHDENAELVRRFKADLERRGHTVWFDEKEIGDWDDWRGKIVRGIDASQMAVAFISHHAIRDPGVCRNEIAIALNRFGAVYPVKVEPIDLGDIPFTVTHLQLPDYSEWRTIRDNGEAGEWQRWYEDKLIRLVEGIEGEATRFADECRVLRLALEPQSFESDIAQHVPGFVGREWLFDEYRHWLDELPESRVFWIKAGPGVGKSAIAANLAHRQRAAIVASWFCDTRSATLRQADAFLKTLAFQLALRWEDYRVRLLSRVGLGYGAPDGMCIEARKQFGRMSAEDLFRHLLAEPMAGLIWREHKLVVVIDALDEATDDEGDNPVADFIGRQLAELPAWISFVVTSRPEADINGRLGGYQPTLIDANDPRNLGDLRLWLEQRLLPRHEFADLADVEKARLADLLIERSEGMVLYLKAVEEGLKERSLTVAQLETLEAGLPGLYRRYYESFQLRFGKDYEDKVKPLLRLLVAALGPLPEDLACETLGWNSEQFLASRIRLGSYVTETPEGYSLFHKTLTDWLTNKDSGVFCVDASIGRQSLADTLFSSLADAAHDPLTCRWRVLCGDWLPYWEIDLNNCKATDRNNLGWLLLLTGCHAEAERLFLTTLALPRSGFEPPTEQHSRSLNGLAVLRTLTCQFEEAEDLFRQSLSLRKNASHFSCLDVVSTLSSYGALLNKLARYGEAESSLREAVTLLREHPSNPAVLAAVLANLGTTLSETRRLDEAEAVTREALSLLQNIHPHEHPEVATAHSLLGGVLISLSTYDEARTHIHRALLIRIDTLPGGHPHIALSLNQLALVNILIGTYKDGEDPLSMIYKALAIQRAALPRLHTDTANTLVLLATIREEDRPLEAEVLLREALMMRTAILPPAHLDIANARGSLARLLRTIRRSVRLSGQSLKDRS